MSALTTKESSRTYTGNRGSFLINPRTGRATCVHYRSFIAKHTSPIARTPPPFTSQFRNWCICGRPEFHRHIFRSRNRNYWSVTGHRHFDGKTDGHAETDSRGVLSASRWRLFTIVNPFSCEIYILTRMTFSDSREFESIFCGFQLKRTVSLFPLLKFSRSLFYNFFRNI